MYIATAVTKEIVHGKYMVVRVYAAADDAFAADSDQAAVFSRHPRAETAARVLADLGFDNAEVRTV